VVVEVEVRVVDPNRPALVERDEAQLLAEAGDEMEGARMCSRNSFWLGAGPSKIAVEATCM